MSEETVVQAAQDQASAAQAKQPAGESTAPVTAEVAVDKVVAQATPVKKAAAAKATKKAPAEKPAPAPKADKPAKKAASEIKAESKVETKAKVAEAPATDKVAKVKKQAAKKLKLVRDSFALPESEYAVFATQKQRALSAGMEVKKSELLRAGLAALAGLSDADFIKSITQVERIKTGRPKK